MLIQTQCTYNEGRLKVVTYFKHEKVLTCHNYDDKPFDNREVPLGRLTGHLSECKYILIKLDKRQL